MSDYTLLTPYLLATNTIATYNYINDDKHVKCECKFMRQTAIFEIKPRYSKLCSN